jgi:hypothetical protein
LREVYRNLRIVELPLTVNAIRQFFNSQIRKWLQLSPMPDEPKIRVLRAETIGLIVIAVMLAIMILARWGGIIPWSAR